MSSMVFVDEPGVILPRVDAGKAERQAAFCTVCGKPSKKRCTRCLVARYCSKECQKSHWTKGKHKRICAVAPTADMAGAADEAHYQCISNYSQKASKAGRLGFKADEIRMLRYLIDTLPNQVDTLFCLAQALFDHKEPRQSLLIFMKGMKELVDIVLQIECMKRRLTPESKPEDHPGVEFPLQWRASLPPEEMLSMYVSQNMHATTNVVEQCIRGRNDLELEVQLMDVLSSYVERQNYDQHDRIGTPTNDACCRVYYIKGETHRKFMQRPDVAEECFMTADGYMMKSKGVHDFVALTAVPDLCMLQVDALITSWSERRESSGSSGDGSDANAVVVKAEIDAAFGLLDRACSVSRMMMEKVDPVQNSQEYTTVFTTLSKTLWNTVSIKDKIHRDILLEEWDDDEKKNMAKEALAVAKQAKLECIKGHCAHNPAIDEQNLAAAEILIGALEGAGYF